MLIQFQYLKAIIGTTNIFQLMIDYERVYCIVLSFFP